MFDGESRVPNREGPFHNEMEAYSASKTAALNEAEAWVKREKLGFDLIAILPAWIFGRDELVTEPEGFKAGSTNSVLLGLLLGSKTEEATFSNSVHVDDVAKIHVLTLDSKVEGNQAFVATSEGLDGRPWKDAIDIAKESFHDAVADGSLKTDGIQPTYNIRIDAKKTEDTFGIKFSGFEEQVKGVAGQYLELLSKA